MILETRHLSKHFDGLVALDSVSFSVEKGEIFGIAGPNGAGKSTLFNVVAGVHPPSGGEIVFDGNDITRLKAHQVCRLGLGRTFQIPQTFSTLTVRDNLRVGALFGGGPELKTANRRDIHDRIDQVMAFLELQAFQDQPATNLDIYTTKLVMLGAVLCSGCRVIMLDEPLAGLSISEIQAFLDLVRRINREMGMTVVVIEHLLDMLIEISDRMLILHNGRVIFLGDPETVRDNEEVVTVYLGKEE